jgi:hypothetical protein
VVDSGFVKTRSMHPSTGMEMLKTGAVSKSQANQVMNFMQYSSRYATSLVFSSGLMIVSLSHTPSGLVGREESLRELHTDYILKAPLKSSLCSLSRRSSGSVCPKLS